MAIYRVTARWTGFTGAPGYSNFHFQGSTGAPDLAPAAAAVRNMFQDMQVHLPSTLRINVSPTIEIYDDASGQLTGYETLATTPAVVSGAATGPYAGPSGAVINWITNTVTQGRRLRGRTFIVPLATSAYDSSGTLTTGALTDINTGASRLSGAGFSLGFGVWSRPTAGGTGAFGEVVGHRVPDLAAVLRSRRD